MTEPLPEPPAAGAPDAVADTLPPEEDCPPAPCRRPRFQLRALTSVIIAVLFVAMVVTGIVLLVAPPHRAGRGGWELWQLSFFEWGAFHTGVTLLFVAVGLLHITLNAKALWCYVRDRSRAGGRALLGFRRELAVGLAAAAGLLGVAAFRLPPLGWLIDEPAERAHGRACGGGRCLAEDAPRWADGERGVQRPGEGRRPEGRRGGRGWRGGRGPLAE